MTLLRILLGLLLGLSVAPVAVAQTNLHPNPDLPSATGWTLTGATWVSTPTKGAGGSFQLAGTHTALGPAIAITPGQVYTCGLYFMGARVPTDWIRLTLGMYNTSGGTKLRNSAWASDWGYHQPNTWQQAGIIHRAASDENFLRLIIVRDSTLSPTGTMNIDSVYCHAGEGVFAEPASAKLPFDGGLVKVDAAGHFSIRQAGGAFQPTFLRCMFTVAGESFTNYAANGWNCNMWATSVGGVQTSVDAGMPYAFYQVGQFIHPTGFAYGDTDQLRTDLAAILASSYANNVIGYYFDNEAPGEFALAEEVFAIVDELDRIAGVRQRPIYILQGNVGRTPAYNDYSNVTGSYHFAADSFHLRTLEGISGQTNPVTFAQIQQAGQSAVAMRDQVMTACDDGATAVAFWHTSPIEGLAWYSSFPTTVADATPCMLAGTESVTEPGSVWVCIDAHTWPASQPTTATCDVAVGTPKAALAMASRAVTSGTSGAGAAMSLGAYDGTRQWAISTATDDNVNPVNSTRRMATDEMVMFQVPADGTVDGEYNASAFVTDGMTWASGDTLAAPALGNVALFGGADLSVYASTFTVNATVGGTVVVSGVPFKADLVLVAGSNQGAPLDTAGGNNYVCIGAAMQIADVVTQASMGRNINDGAATGDVGAVVEDRYACAHASATALLQAVELSAFTATGFTATTRVAVNALVFGFLAFNFNGTKKPFLHAVNAPTAPGSVPITVAAGGLTPEVGFMLATTSQTVRTLENDVDGNGFALGMFTATQAATVGTVAEDTSNPNDNGSFVSPAAVRLDSLVGTTLHEATLSSMSANTVTLNFSAASGVVRKWILFGWSGTPAVVVGVTQRSQFTW